jgi:hypothetical protein
MMDSKVNYNIMNKEWAENKTPRNTAQEQNFAVAVAFMQTDGRTGNWKKVWE